MYALMKSQGCYLTPWRADLRLGAEVNEDGALHVLIGADWPWEGTLHFDVPRHDEYWNMPVDYPRLNQFPEWYTVGKDGEYLVRRDGEERAMSAADLREGLAVRLGRDETQTLMIQKR